MAAVHELRSRAEGGPREPAAKRRPPRRVEVSPWSIGVMLAAILLLGVLLWSALRERESHVRVPADLASFEDALPSIAGMTGSPLLDGNDVRVLQDGDGFFPALLADIEAARETVHFETYVWWTGEICAQVAEALAAKAREGVEVRLLVDAVGGKSMDGELEELMTGAGVRLARYHPFSLSQLAHFNNRTHRKLVIVDGRVAHVFGHGIAQEWTGRGQDEEHWRDTGVRLAGPIVGAVQSVFAAHWVEQTGEALLGERHFPELAPAGPVRAHVVASAPQGGVSAFELLFKAAIASAQREIVIQNPYFIPDGELVGLLARAVERGVEVRIMLPGAVTDSSIVQHAGHYPLGDLLASGVEVWEHGRTLIHQKVMVVDRVWSLVGSTNFDDRSLDINDESSVGLVDERVAAELLAAFERDLAASRRLEPAAWADRSLWHRATDRLAYLVNEQL